MQSVADIGYWHGLVPHEPAQTRPCTLQQPGNRLDQYGKYGTPSCHIYFHHRAIIRSPLCLLSCRTAIVSVSCHGQCRRDWSPRESWHAGWSSTGRRRRAVRPGMSARRRRCLAVAHIQEIRKPLCPPIVCCSDSSRW